MNKSIDSKKAAKLTDLLSHNPMFRKKTIQFHAHVEG